VGYPTELRTIGDHIRRRRLDLGLSQRKAAARMGVSNSKIENWEGSQTTPPTAYLTRISGFLGYEVDDPAASLVRALAGYRQAAGLTRAELARRIGVHPTVVFRWETGRRGMSRALLRTLEAFMAELTTSKPE
jgi:transcriptional regulator with XRE-family HTH domain